MNAAVPRIRGIFFDLDDTLIGYTEAERIALTAGCRLAARRNPAIDEHSLATAIFQIFADEFEYGTPGYAALATMSVEDFRTRLTREALRLLGVDDPALTAELVAAYRIAERDALRPYDDAAETLRLLQPHFRLGIITNGPSTFQREKLAAVALTDWFAEIVVDTEFGCPKPDPRVFDHAAQRIGLSPDELLFVGNSLEADIAGARQSGWTSVWMNENRAAALPEGGPSPDWIVGSLSELPHLPPIAAALGAATTAERI